MTDVRPPTASNSQGSQPARDAPAGPMWRRLLDIGLRTVGTVAGVWAALVLAVYGAFLTPLNIDGWRVPVSLLIAVGGNAVTIWFVYRVTRHRFVALLPGLAWVVVAFRASGGTTEGDIVLAANNWVAITFLLLGSATVGVAAYWLLVTRTPNPGLRLPRQRPTGRRARR